MPDVLDAVLQGLSLGSLEILDKIDLNSERASYKCSEQLQKSLNTVEDLYLKQCIQEMNMKSEQLVSKTRTFKSMLEKYTKQLSQFKVEEPQNNDNHKKIKAYTEEIEKVSKALKEVMHKAGDLEADQIFLEMDEMHKTIQELEEKCKELTKKMKIYQGFPANITEAEYCLTDLKERIKKKEASLTSLGRTGR